MLSPKISGKPLPSHFKILAKPLEISSCIFSIRCTLLDNSSKSSSFRLSWIYQTTKYYTSEEKESSFNNFIVSLKSHISIKVAALKIGGGTSHSSDSMAARTDPLAPSTFILHQNVMRLAFPTLLCALLCTFPFSLSGWQLCSGCQIANPFDPS